LYPQLDNPDDQTKKNMAYNVQKALEKIFVERVASALKIKYSNNVILGGGCALNILGNSEVKKHFPNINVYPEPIAADAAQSIGAALYHYKLEFPDTKFKKIDNLYLGPHYEPSTIKQRLLHLLEQHNNESSLPVNSNPQ
jgi:predicted NodU family carbamoyl transferase